MLRDCRAELRCAVKEGPHLPWTDRVADGGGRAGGVDARVGHDGRRLVLPRGLKQGRKEGLPKQGMPDEARMASQAWQGRAAGGKEAEARWGGGRKQAAAGGGLKQAAAGACRGVTDVPGLRTSLTSLTGSPSCAAPRCAVPRPAVLCRAVSTSFLAVVAGNVLPGDWGFFSAYLIGGISIGVLAVGSTAPGLLQFAIDKFSQVGDPGRRWEMGAGREPGKWAVGDVGLRRRRRGGGPLAVVGRGGRLCRPHWVVLVLVKQVEVAMRR